ncbi:MAG: hypothetical protein PVI55_20225, partial [Desulfobacterales bacterium]
MTDKGNSVSVLFGENLIVPARKQTIQFNRQFLQVGQQYYVAAGKLIHNLRGALTADEDVSAPAQVATQLF